VSLVARLGGEVSECHRHLSHHYRLRGYWTRGVTRCTDTNASTVMVSCGNGW